MQKTAFELRISDWSSDVCSSDLVCACNPYARCLARTIGASRLRRIDIRPSRQRARYGLDRFQARTKTGDRFLLAFQPTIGKIGDLKICDPAEAGPCELPPPTAPAGIGRDKEQHGGGVHRGAAQDQV